MSLDTALVVDLGSHQVRAGYAGTTEPQVIQSLVGREVVKKKMLFRKKKKDEESDDEEEPVIGDEAMLGRGRLQLSYPIERAQVNNWEDIVMFWGAMFDELEMDEDGEKPPIVITEPPYQPKIQRQRLVDLIFDGFDGTAVAFVPTSVCTLTSYGRTTGLVLDSGEGVTHAVPIYDTYPLGWSVIRQDLGGRDCTDYMARLFYEKSYNFNTASAKETVRELKESHGFVALNYDKSLEGEEETTEVDLPDGSTVELGNEAFRAAEVMFKPSLVSKDMLGIHELCYKTIQGVDPELRGMMQSNILLSGGNTMWTNFSERLKEELNRMAPPGSFCNFNINASDDRNQHAWQGASILSEIPAFKGKWVTREMYEEEGIELVHQRAFNCVGS